MTTESEEHTCERCGSCFGSPQALGTHNVSCDDSTYTCDECGGEFDHPGALAKHKQSHEDNAVTQEEYLEDVERVADGLGDMPTISQYNEVGEFSDSLAYNLFSNWAEVRERLGYGERNRKKYSDGELLNGVAALAEEIGRPPTKKQAGEELPYATGTWTRRFNDWKTVLRKVEERGGFNSLPTKTPDGYECPTCRRRVGAPEELAGHVNYHGETPNNDKLIGILQEVADELGHTPTIPEFKELSEYTANLLTNRFGSYNQAVDEAGLETNRVTSYNVEFAIEELHRVADKLDDTPTYVDMLKLAECSPSPLTTHFGTWNQALEAVGYEPNETPSGEDSPHWKGGEGRIYGPGWGERKRRAVRARDDYECQICGLSQTEHKSKYGVALDVHHIVPARLFDVEDRSSNEMSNLITLCRKHHAKWEGIPLKPERA